MIHTGPDIESYREKHRDRTADLRGTMGAGTEAREMQQEAVQRQ